MTNETPAATARHDRELRALTRDLSGAPDPQLRRIVAAVDAMATRGPADALIEPLRQRLLVLRPPRPLRFDRLMFYPLDSLIVPAARWTARHHTIPRTALAPMAEQVSRMMGAEARTIAAEIIGRTTADGALIQRLGGSLWPAAARILAAAQAPERWAAATGFNEQAYQRLARSVALLLGHAATLDALCAEAANGLLSPDPERIATMLGRIAATDPPVLPMLITLLLLRLPQATESLVPGHAEPTATMIQAALDQAVGRVLQQLDEEEGTEAQIAKGTLSDASAAAARIATLLTQLDRGPVKDKRHLKLRTLRLRLDAGCRARFTLGLQEELLIPLQDPGGVVGDALVRKLECAARGLRMLEREARAIGSGPVYQSLLRSATEMVRAEASGDRLTKMDRIRLVEILSGPDMALAMLDQA